MTYSDKYALMKSYKIITGEDPDQNQVKQVIKSNRQLLKYLTIK